MSSVKKAVIPAAGLGTRMLPISCAVPKEMLPIVDLPAVYYLVREAAESGISDIQIITNRGKAAMEDFFDYAPEYEAHLRRAGREEEIAALRRIADLARVTFVRQKEARGLGHAVLQTRAFAGDEPFVVLYGDDIIFSRTPVARQLMDVYEEYGHPAAAVRAVSPALLSRYCSLKVGDPLRPGVYHCTDMIEKPKPGEEFSPLAILGRVLLTPAVFPILATLAPGAGGEIQLTDAMAALARTEGMTALEFEGDRYDMGSKLGFLTANVVRGAAHEEVGAAFRAFLREFVAAMGED